MLPASVLLSGVIPVYNERATLEELLRRVRSVLIFWGRARLRDAVLPCLAVYAVLGLRSAVARHGTVGAATPAPAGR